MITASASLAGAWAGSSGAGMLGQPVYFLTPEVVGVHLKRRAA